MQRNGRAANLLLTSNGQLVKDSSTRVLNLVLFRRFVLVFEHEGEDDGQHKGEGRKDVPGG